METVQGSTTHNLTINGLPEDLTSSETTTELPLCANQDLKGHHQMEVCPPGGPKVDVCPPRGCEMEVGNASQGVTAEGQWWHVNKGGFPIPEATWEKMWQHVTDTHPNGAAIPESIRERPCRRVPFPPVPSVPQHSVQESLVAVQTYLQQLQYNHTGTQFFEIRKNRPLSRLMETAKEMIHDSLPIKCLEAVIVALYLTAPLTSVQRFTLGFKSKCGDMYYRHVVLGVYHGGSYGALGLSRRKDLMYKPLVHKSLMDLIQDFIDSYEHYQHTVVKVKLSPPIVHDLYSCEQIQWKFLCLPLGQLHTEEMKKIVEKFSRTMRTMQS